MDPHSQNESMTNMMNGQVFQHVHARRGGSVTDAETTLTPVMRNDLGEQGIGFYNDGHSRNDKIDALAAQQSHEADANKREELVKAALREWKEWFEVAWLTIGK